jgi:hypothetical protein
LHQGKRKRTSLNALNPLFFPFPTLKGGKKKHQDIILKRTKFSSPFRTGAKRKFQTKRPRSPLLPPPLNKKHKKQRKNKVAAVRETSVKHERLGSRQENLSDDFWIKIFRLDLLFLLYQDKRKDHLQDIKQYREQQTFI